MDSPMEVLYSHLQVDSIFFPCHAIDSGRSLPFQALITDPQLFDGHMVQQGCELSLLILLGCFAHTVQPGKPAFPALRPVRVRLLHVLLGPRPSLHSLRWQITRLCSAASSVLWRSTTPHGRACGPYLLVAFSHRSSPIQQRTATGSLGSRAWCF